MSRNPVRVLFVQPLVPAYREPFFAGLHAREDIEVEVWSDERGAGSLASVSTTRFRTAHRPERKLGAFFSQPALVEASRSTSHDVVVFPWNSRYLELVPAVLVARARGLRVLLWGHGYSKSETSYARAVRNGIGRLASGCVTYSYGAARRLVQDGFAEEKVFVAQNALDRAPIEEALASLDGVDVESAAADFVALGSGPVAVFVSRLEPGKHVEVLLDAFRLVAGRVVDAKLVLIGDGTARGTLEEHVRRLGLEARIHFAGAIYEEERLALWMRRADIFTYPTNVGLSVLHAFHYGLPIVTSADPGAHNPEFEAVVPGINAEVYPDGDTEAFAAAIERLLADPERLSRMKSAALETVLGRDGHTMPRMIDGMEAAVHGRCGSLPARVVK